MSFVDIRSDVEAGKLTLSEALELSRLLDEKWGVSASDDRGELEADFVAPLVERFMQVGLTSPDEHLAAVRSSLARAIAA